MTNYSTHSITKMARIDLADNFSGSEKQIEWARTIKAEMVKMLDDAIYNRIQRMTDEAKIAEARTNGNKLIDSLVAKLDTITEARWYIDNRMISINDLIRLTM